MVTATHEGSVTLSRGTNLDTHLSVTLLSQDHGYIEIDKVTEEGVGAVSEDVHCS